jgi:hypothetical protein
MRLTIMCVIIMGLVGCASGPPDIKYQEKYIPIPMCPTPPSIEVVSYYANTLTDDQSNDMGELAKAYVISSKESVNRNAKLQMVYDTYKEIAENSESRLKAIESMGGLVDRTMVEQANRDVKSQLQSLSLQI